jgi:hypothetical protein
MTHGNPLSFPIVSLKDGSGDKQFQSKTSGDATPSLPSRQLWESAQSSPKGQWSVTSTPQSVVADMGKSTQSSRLAVDPFVV